MEKRLLFSLVTRSSKKMFWAEHRLPAIAAPLDFLSKIHSMPASFMSLIRQEECSDKYMTYRYLQDPSINLQWWLLGMFQNCNIMGFSKNKSVFDNFFLSYFIMMWLQMYQVKYMVMQYLQKLQNYLCRVEE